MNEIPGSMLVVEPDRHEILDGESWAWLTWVKDQIKNPNLVVYRHRESKRFILCQWVYRPGDRFPDGALQELEGFSGSPASVWPEGLLGPEVLVARLRPVDDELKRHRLEIRRRRYEERRRREDGIEERAQYCKYLRQRGDPEGAAAIEAGLVPWEPRSMNPQVFDEIVEQLYHLHRAKTVSTVIT